MDKGNNLNITYLLGAGASYQAVPIVNEIDKALNLMIGWLGTNVNNDTLKGGLDLLEALVNTNAKQSLIYGTVDTYARKLFLTNEYDFKMLKLMLAAFFEVWQHTPKTAISDQSTFGRHFREVDTRYFGLMANWLIKQNQKLKLQDNVKFISWNYDSQLELALASFNDKTLEEVIELYEIAPINRSMSTNRPEIIHLNGMAGFFGSVASEKPSNDFRRLGNGMELIKTVLSKVRELEPQNADYSNLPNFAWELNPSSSSVIQYALNVLDTTDILVIIGYSFPTFNDSVDKQLFKQLKESRSFKLVYFQDPNANAELISTRFGIPNDKIRIVKNVDQFLIPLDTHSYQPPLYDIH